MFRKILQPFYTFYVVVTFLACLFIAFPFFALISIGNNIAARRAIHTIIKYWAKMWLWLIGMPLTIQGDTPPKGRYVMVSNHISYLDAIVIFAAMPRHFRALGKIEFSKIPLLGFIYRQIVIMVDRGSPESRAQSMRAMQQVLKAEADVYIYPEGTFNETGAVLKEFYNGAFRLAISAQTSILPVIFPDTVKRWHYSAWWKLSPGRNRAVFLPPVSVNGMAMEDMRSLKAHVYSIMETGLKKQYL